MDEVVKEIFSYKTVILMVAVVILTFFIRRIVETALPAVKAVNSKAVMVSPALSTQKVAHQETFLSHFSMWWNQVILYLIPVVLGSALALCVQELMAIEHIKTTMGMALYGGIAGWFSTTGYSVLRKLVKTKTGADLPSVGVASVYPTGAAEPGEVEPEAVGVAVVVSPAPTTESVAVIVTPDPPKDAA